jgi:hypothetical protein
LLAAAALSCGRAIDTPPIPPAITPKLLNCTPSTANDGLAANAPAIPTPKTSADLHDLCVPDILSPAWGIRSQPLLDL